MSKPKFFHRYLAHWSMFQRIEGSWIVYWTDIGCIRSSCQWMIPGTWHGED